jgi:hypothetical protein
LRAIELSSECGRLRAVPPARGHVLTWPLEAQVQCRYVKVKPKVRGLKV